MIVSRATAVSSTGVVANDNRSSDSACANRARPSEPSSTLLLAFVPLFRHWCSHDPTRWEELRNIQFQPNEHWAQWPNGQWNLAGEFHEFVYLPVLHHSDSTVPLDECTIKCDWFARAWIRLDCIFVNAVSRTKISISSWLSGQPYKRKNWSKYRSFPEKMEDLTGMPIYHIKETAMTLGSAQKIQGFSRKVKKFQDFQGPWKCIFRTQWFLRFSRTCTYPVTNIQGNRTNSFHCTLFSYLTATCSAHPSIKHNAFRAFFDTAISSVRPTGRLYALPSSWQSPIFSGKV